METTDTKIIPAAEAQAIIDAVNPRAEAELAREEPDWNDLCADLGCAELFVAAPSLARSVIAQHEANARLARERDSAARAQQSDFDSLYADYRARGEAIDTLTRERDAALADAARLRVAAGEYCAAIESTEPVTREFWLRAETARDALRAAIGGER